MEYRNDGPGLIHDLLAAQARRTPQAIAVLTDTRSLTFAELDEQADELAALLRGHGVGPDVLVGVFLERSVEMVVALFAILRAGGAYVPLDPDYPFERLRYILEDAAPRAVLTQRTLRDALPTSAAIIISLDENPGHTSPAARLNEHSPELPQQHSHLLAYVIYTSGSTGWPKGVMVEHRHVLNLWHGLESLYHPCLPCERVALNASIAFDASVQQLVQLLAGRTLYILSNELRRDPSRLLRAIEANKIAAIDCTPSQLKSWLDAGLLETLALRLVLIGGEPIDPPLWSVLSRCRHIAFYNVYGPTECTVDVTAARLNADTSHPHIGHPMEGRLVYVLGHDREPVPVGARGEIYIGGIGVARGYLNRPELTTERFLQDPFASSSDSRMYRTGDMAVRRPDGALEFRGRDDSQVKIRGHRIELEEIESQLMLQEQVTQAVVSVWDEPAQDKRLVAYVVLRQTADSTVAAGVLRTHLARSLPEYMIPNAFVFLDGLPLNPSGKIDRHRLPPPQRAVCGVAPYAEPRGEIEMRLASVWQTVLGLDRVGRHDNFFQLGGDSLLLVDMLAHARRAGFVIEVAHVFQNRTLKAMASTLVFNGEPQSEVSCIQGNLV